MPTLSYPGTPGTTLYAGLPTPSVGGLITTLSLVNTSGSTQAANFVSPMLGMPFKQGDVPSGQYPQFQLTDNTPCPATIWGVTTWPDGSMKFCGAMIRVPTTIAGSGTLTINVKNGGSAPAASSRGTSDFTAADLKTELSGVTNLSGVWTASLNTAITDATDIVVIGDGPAGKLWRIRAPFKQSATAHGQLECYFYAFAAQNNAGGLSHIECLPRVALPWGDVASPTPTRIVVNCVLKSGATTLLTMTGHDTTETPGANIALNHYSSFYVCDTDGLWNFIQGGGTTSARPTVLVQHDPKYIVKTRLVEPYDLSVTPSSVSSVNYVAGCLGSLAQRSLNATGPNNFIGVIPQWCVTHLFTQAAVDRRAVIVSSLACGGFETMVRRSTTGNIIPVVDVEASYTDLGTIQTSWRFGNSFFTGVQTPSVTTSLWSGDGDPSHRPSAHYYAYLISGRPEMADMMDEYAAQIIMYTDPGTYTRNVGTGITTLRNGSYAGARNIKIGPSGTTYKGAGIGFLAGGARLNAWAMRDVAQGLAILPDSYPSKPYFEDVLESTYAALNDLNSQMPTSWQDAGLYSASQNAASSESNDTLYESPWMQMYFSMSLCHQYEITQLAGAATFRQHLAKFISSVHAQMDLVCMTAYRWSQWKGDGTLVDSIEDVLFSLSVDLAFDTGTDRATISGPFGTFAPTNGDKFAFTENLDANKPFAEAIDEQAFFAVGASGQTMQLSATAGGSMIPVTSGVSIGKCLVQLKDASPLLSLEDGTYYQKLLYEAARFHEACGDTVVASARTQHDTNIAAAGISFTTDPRSALAAAYPE